MREEKVLAERFEAERVRLRSVAYRMLGTIAEAEDAVQEAWFKLSRSDVSEVKNLGALANPEALEQFRDRPELAT